MLSNEVKCKCGEIILKSYGKKTKIRSMILVCNDNDVMAKCRKCKTEHELPIKVELDKISAKNIHFLLD